MKLKSAGARDRYAGCSLLAWERRCPAEEVGTRGDWSLIPLFSEHKGPVQVTQVEEDKVMVLMDGEDPPPPLSPTAPGSLPHPPSPAPHLGSQKC